MRILSSIGFVTELDTRIYTGNALTKAMTIPALVAATKIMHDNSAQVEMRLHEYFRIHGYRSPIDGNNCAFQWTFNTDLTYFQRIHATPETTNDFNTFMSGFRSKRGDWLNWFPVEQQLFCSMTGPECGEEVLIVDVGGGSGHDLERFLTRFPQAKGHLVLQELPSTISSLNHLNTGIKAMSHDMFTPQPIKGEFSSPTFSFLDMC